MSDVDRPGTEHSEGLRLTHAPIWEMRLPSRPRFVSDLVTVPVADGIHVVGVDALTLRGPSAQWVLDELAPLLDGSRSVAALAQAQPEVSAESLLDVLHLLNAHGLLEEDADDLPAQERDQMAQAHGGQLEFFSRYLRVTGHFRSRFEVQRALALARVAVVGDSRWAVTLGDQLVASGVDGVLRVGATRSAGVADVDLVVSVGEGAVHEHAARDCLLADRPLLCLDPGSLRIGPLMFPRASACPACALSQLPEPTGPDRGWGQGHDLWAMALVSRTAQLVVGQLSRLFQPPVIGGVERWDPSSGQAGLHDVLRLPGCAVCGDRIRPLTVTLPGGVRDNMALLYHRNAAIQSWHLQQPAGMQQHLSPETKWLSRSAFLRHDGTERVQLLRPTHRVVGSRSRSVEQDLATLAQVLHYSAGGRSAPTIDGDHQLVRYTASGGNLGSAELYVVLPEQWGALAGLHHYLMVDGTLERLREGAVSDEFAECALDGTTDGSRRLVAGAAAVVVIVSAVQRLRAKYGERAYLYALLDAGLMAHRLRLLASRSGWRCDETWDFDDAQLSAVLGVDGRRMVPAMVLALRRPADQPLAEVARVTGDEVEPAPEPWQEDGTLRPSGLAARLVATSSHPRGRHGPVGEPPVRPLPGDIGRARVLPTAGEEPGDGRGLIDIIEARRSAGLTPGPLTLRDLSALLVTTAIPLPPAFAPRPELVPAVFPVVHHVADLQPGCYRYDPQRHAVLPVAGIDWSTQSETLMLQHEHGEGGLVLFLVVPLALWLHRFGDRGYRGAALQVGHLTDRLYLRAEALGLTYTASGGFAQARADTLLGLDSYHHTAFFAFVVGGPRRLQEHRHAD